MPLPVCQNSVVGQGTSDQVYITLLQLNAEILTNVGFAAIKYGSGQ